jgi:predicted nucleic acid-binding protein
MSNGPRRIYWDANVFLGYLEKTPDRIATLDALMAAAGAEGDIQIWTSTFTITEVAFAEAERTGRALEPAVEEAIDDLWQDGTIHLAEFSAVLALDARRLVREAMIRNVTAQRPNPPALRAKDAVHLATARYIGVEQFHTYDVGLLNQPREPFRFSIQEPFTERPRLFS